MKSNAPGQLLGYTLQYPRALCHLLKSGPGDSVCVEDLGDVATRKSNSDVIAEEDKSSIIGNPLTDRSTDLWKTFSNWIDLIDSNNLDVKNTKFVLYCNQSGRDSIVTHFSCAQNQTDAQSAINYAKEVLDNITEEHDIWKYYDFVINQNETLLLDIVERFELQIGNGAGYEDVRYEIQRKHVPESQIEHLMHVLGGWLQKKISEKIANRKPAIISWEEFDHQFSVLFTRARCLDLIDFASEIKDVDEDVENQVKSHPIYLQQLEAIDIYGDEIIEAVSDYLRADINREKWIECEIIDEEVALDFELKLKKWWENQATKIEIIQKSLTEKERGKLLFVECKSIKETIRDMSPPYSTIAGTYHALSNEPCLGWHPNWKDLFPEQKEE